MNPSQLKNMKIKVCGMRHAQNIAEVAALGVDYLGFIFYEKSPRFVQNTDLIAVKTAIAAQKVGVFVNADAVTVVETVKKYGLQAVQLHGKESPAYLEDLRQTLDNTLPHSTSIIKAFSVDETFDFQLVSPYLDNSDYFLFDTKTPQYGGAGVKFDWSILQKYNFNTPFFLAGGINDTDAAAIKNAAATIPQLYALDLNSRFETEPALKDVARLRKFIEELRN